MNKEGYANLVQNIHVKIIPSVICQKKETRARLHKTPVTVTGIRTCTRNLSELH